MFCPVCEAEYTAGQSRCPDDNAKLVERLNPATARDGSEARFVLLHNFGSPAEAEMVNDLISQNGIRSVVRSGSSEPFSALFSATAPAAAVLVDERDLDRAQELYAAFFGDDTTPLTGTLIEEDKENTEDYEDNEQ